MYHEVLSRSPGVLTTLFVTQMAGESASLSDEADSDGEWVDVHHSSDEEQKEIVSPKSSCSEC